jgi:hypothetical protein
MIMAGCGVWGCFCILFQKPAVFTNLRISIRIV